MPDLMNLISRLNRRSRVLVAVAVALVLGLGAAGAWWWSTDRLSDGAALSVLGEEVTETELNERSRMLGAFYGVVKPADDPELEKYWRDLAASSALAKVLDHAAAERDVTVTDKEAEQALSRYITRYYGQGQKGNEGFTDALGAAATSRPAVLQEVRRQLVLAELFRRVTEDVTEPDGDDVAGAYDQRSCNFEVPEQRRLANIVVATRRDGTTAKARLRAGTRFADVAKAMSLDASTANGGGDLGWVVQSNLEKAYGKAAFGAARGQSFGPVRTSSGWNVGMVLRTRPARTPPLAEVREQLKGLLLSEKRSAAWRAWLLEQLESADVQYADDFEPADPLALPEAIDPVSDKAPEPCGDEQAEP